LAHDVPKTRVFVLHRVRIQLLAVLTEPRHGYGTLVCRTHAENHAGSLRWRCSKSCIVAARVRPREDRFHRRGENALYDGRRHMREPPKNTSATSLLPIPVAVIERHSSTETVVHDGGREDQAAGSSQHWFSHVRQCPRMSIARWPGSRQSGRSQRVTGRPRPSDGASTSAPNVRAFITPRRTSPRDCEPR
jgi:hypothetical protein